MKRLLATMAVCFPLLCSAAEQLVAAVPLADFKGSTCNVFVSEYQAGSNIMYIGNCGWWGLKGTAAYVQTWNFDNHVKVVRGHFDSGRTANIARVVHIDQLNRVVEVYDEGFFVKSNQLTYNLDDILADMKQARVRIDKGMYSYVQFANYMDTLQ